MQRLFLVLALGVWFSQTSFALLVKLADMHTMAKNSDVVVHGIVGDTQVITDEMGRNITLSHVEVVDGLYGAKTGQVIQVYQVGGAKDGVVMPVVGGQNFMLGQEVFFFGLKMDDAYVSFGAGQGKLNVERVNGQEVVTEDLGDVQTLLGLGKNGLRPISPMPLFFPEKEILKDEIRKMLKTR